MPVSVSGNMRLQGQQRVVLDKHDGIEAKHATSRGFLAFTEYRTLMLELEQRCKTWSQLTHAERMSWEAAASHIADLVSPEDARQRGNKKKSQAWQKEWKRCAGLHADHREGARGDGKDQGNVGPAETKRRYAIKDQPPVTIREVKVGREE